MSVCLLSMRSDRALREPSLLVRLKIWIHAEGDRIREIHRV
jgi:hypothetical protein